MRSLAGFRYLLEHTDGEPADPEMFYTAFDGWKVGDTFLAGPDLRSYRILLSNDRAQLVRSGYAHALWVVEPVGTAGSAPALPAHAWELVSIGSDGSRETHDYASAAWLNPGDRFPIDHFGERVIVEVDGIEASHIEGRAKVTTHVVED
jgi:hypothetical protein